MEFDFRETSVAALAYLGDSVIEVLTREYLLRKKFTRSEELNREALHYVTAEEQARAMERIIGELTEEEKAIFLHGKNPGKLRPPAAVSLENYRIATGMEVLFAALFLNGEKDRMRELFSLGYDADESVLMKCAALR